jgi:hypothetical protein
MFTIVRPMYVEIDEPIVVGAVFSHGGIKPVWFAWNGREIRIREIAFTWKTREGSIPILHFSVADGRGLYEIVYNTGTFKWRINGTE